MGGEQVGVFLQVVQAIGLPATMGLVGLAAWAYERRQNNLLQAKLLDLATGQIQSSMKVEAAVAAISSAMGGRKR